MVHTDQLGRANTVVGLGDQMPLLIGEALVGPALTLLGPVLSITVPAVMLLLAAALACRLPSAAASPVGHVDTPTSPGGDRTRQRLPRGVPALILLSTAYYLAYGPFETVMPGFVRDRLHANPNAYSLVWAAFGLGAVLGLAAGPILSRRRPGLVNALGAATWGLLMLPIAIISTVPAATSLFLVSGVVWGPYTTVEAGALQRWTPPAQHGRIFGLQRGLLGTAAPVGAAIGAIAMQHAAPHLILAASAATCACAGLLALTHPALRRAR
jgi:Major Facilitator Superfamily